MADKPLVYKAADAGAGTVPAAFGLAYTNSVRDATTTTLYKGCR